jgi:hypothetical protein
MLAVYYPAHAETGSCSVDACPALGPPGQTRGTANARDGVQDRLLEWGRGKEYSTALPTEAPGV